jgi:hypothetical protein
MEVARATQGGLAPSRVGRTGCMKCSARTEATLRTEACHVRATVLWLASRRVLFLAAEWLGINIGPEIYMRDVIGAGFNVSPLHPTLQTDAVQTTVEPKFIGFIC